MEANGNGNGTNGHANGDSAETPKPQVRTNTGKFVKGHPGLPGAGKNRKTTEFRKMFKANISEQDIMDVVDNLKAAALAEPFDIPAIKLFLEYTVGKPEDVIKDGGPLGTMNGDQLIQYFSMIVLQALAPFPGAKLAVAAALQGVSVIPDQDENDNAPPLKAIGYKPEPADDDDDDDDNGFI